jgi:secreted trypsin-like serine protease
LSLNVLSLWTTIALAAEEELRTQAQRTLIIGGAQSTPGRFPYRVLLVNAGYEMECGGTLIASQCCLDSGSLQKWFVAALCLDWF